LPTFHLKHLVTALLLVLADASVVRCVAASESTSVDPDDALQMLIDGNTRFVAGKSIHPEESLARRAEQAKGQMPFAVVVGCSDSRVPPELVFDHGLGTLFVVRTAGHLLDDLVLASIEYGVEHLS
jgi:carbonic anhydrase